jgi:hypothetical protein
MKNYWNRNRAAVLVFVTASLLAGCADRNVRQKGGDSEDHSIFSLRPDAATPEKPRIVTLTPESISASEKAPSAGRMPDSLHSGSLIIPATSAIEPEVQITPLTHVTPMSPQ